MPGSLTTPGCPSTRVGVLDHIAFRYLYSVGTQDIPIAAQWLACALPCRRFTAGLADLAAVRNDFSGFVGMASIRAKNFDLFLRPQSHKVTLKVRPS
jgi:hypothetical protein